MSNNDPLNDPLEAEIPTVFENYEATKGSRPRQILLIVGILGTILLICVALSGAAGLIIFGGVGDIFSTDLTEVDFPFATSEPDELGQPPEGWTEVIEDSFDGNPFAWPEETYDLDESMVVWDVTDGFYVWFSEGGEATTWWAYPEVGVNHSDVYVTVEAALSDGLPEAAGYGILFRQVDDDHYYSFFISGIYYALHVNLGEGEWEELIPWTQTDLLTNPTPKLTVHAAGGDITILIDDQRVGQVYDTTYEDGNVGLVLTHFEPEIPVIVHFDNFTLHTPK